MAAVSLQRFLLLFLCIIVTCQAQAGPCDLSTNTFLGKYIHSYSSLKKFWTHSKQLQSSQNDPSYPVWPLAFNVTLAKTNPFDETIVWTKLYYDYAHNRSSFVFFDKYMDNDGNWGAVNCVILFVNTTIFFIKPKTSSCVIRTKEVPTIDPHWVRWAEYKGTGLFREMYSQKWVFPDSMGELAGMTYYNRVDKWNTPIRSKNQPADPGVTDYYDFIVGDQDPSTFKVPSYCPNE